MREIGIFSGSAHPELRAALMSAVAERAPKVDRDRVAHYLRWCDASLR